jgi:hypothetical protein
LLEARSLGLFLCDGCLFHSAGHSIEYKVMGDKNTFL